VLSALRRDRTITVPRLLRVEPAALAGLPGALVEEFDLRRVMVACGAGTSRAIAGELAAGLEALGVEVALEPELVGTLTEAARVLERLDHAPVSLVVAVGGGQPIDVAKLAAFRAGVSLVAVPTILSHDGMASPVASLAAADGTRRSLGARMPTGVVIDLDVVAAAPDRYVRAGIGDLVSNITAIEDWRSAHAHEDEPFDEFAASIALLGATAAMEVGWPLRPADLEAVARGLLMSGLAMEVAGSSRPCSGAEHLVSHALDHVRGAGAGLHGEHVAIGVLVALALQDNPHRLAIRSLFDRIGLPLTLAGWGLDESTVTEAVRLAPSTRPGRRTALDAADLSPEGARALVRAAFEVAT
jgi:glycerol-1-phosphate dehydrogenase [NAD(P)+]